MVKIIGTDSSASRYFIFCHSVVVQRLSLSRPVFPYLPLYLYFSRPHPHTLLGLLLRSRHFDRTITISILDFWRTTSFQQLRASIVWFSHIRILHEQMLSTPKVYILLIKLLLVLTASITGFSKRPEPCILWDIWNMRIQLVTPALLTNPPAIWSFAGVNEAVSHHFTAHKHGAPQIFFWITNSHWIHLCVNTLCIPRLEVVFQPSQAVW